MQVLRRDPDPLKNSGMVPPNSLGQLHRAASRVDYVPYVHARMLACSTLSRQAVSREISTRGPWGNATNRGMAHESMGRRIARLRKQKGLTQSALAAEIGLARAYIAGIESGKDRPGLESARAIANFFRMSLDELLGDDVPGRKLMGPSVRRRARALRRSAWGEDINVAASEIGIDAATIAKYEAGEVPLDDHYLEMLSKASRVTVEWLHTGDFNLLPSPVVAARIGAADAGLVFDEWGPDK